MSLGHLPDVASSGIPGLDAALTLGKRHPILRTDFSSLTWRRSVQATETSIDNVKIYRVSMKQLFLSCIDYVSETMQGLE